MPNRLYGQNKGGRGKKAQVESKTKNAGITLSQDLICELTNRCPDEWTRSYFVSQILQKALGWDYNLDLDDCVLSLDVQVTQESLEADWKNVSELQPEKPIVMLSAPNQPVEAPLYTDEEIETMTKEQGIDAVFLKVLENRPQA